MPTACELIRAYWLAIRESRISDVGGEGVAPRPFRGSLRPHRRRRS